MPRDKRRRIADSLQDVLEAADRIARWTSDRSYSDYQNDEILQSAVERQFEIVGEALRNVDEQDSTFRSLLPETGSIIGMRNSIAHGYFAVDDSVVWSAITGYLPMLRAHVEQILSDTEQ